MFPNSRSISLINGAMIRISLCRRHSLGINISFGRRNKSDSKETTYSDIKESDFHPKNVLLLRKVTRYEYEKLMYKEATEEGLKEQLRCKGSDYNGLLARHDEYLRSLDRIVGSMTKHGMNVDVVKRHGYTIDKIQKSDAVFTAGGDGTFLLASSRMAGRSVPVIGINTDTIRSEGVLCLPRTLSNNVDLALERMLNGEFKWMWRQRIRITIKNMAHRNPVDLHDQVMLYPEYRFQEHVAEHEHLNSRITPGMQRIAEARGSYRLPILALNEVFLGESLAARVSFYEMSIDNSVPGKQKSSGVTVCTGTGSTSWYFNINHVPSQSIHRILEMGKNFGRWDVEIADASFIHNIARQFNSSQVFDPSELKMAYVVRDPIPHGIFQVTCHKGFCKRASIKSRMWDAWVVVDGGISYPFNDGAVVDLELHEEDALRCMEFS